MKSLWEVLSENGDLDKVNCSWCGDEEQLYFLEGDMVCENCLRKEEYEEPEYGLTLEERNR